MPYVTAASVLVDLIPMLLSNVTAPVFRIAEYGALASFILPVGEIVVLGGMPGIGKSSFIFQVIADFLRLNVNCRALIANVEMAPQELLTRELSRLSGVYLAADRTEGLSSEEQSRLTGCRSTLDSYASRLAILPIPFTLNDIIEAIEAFDPTLVVIDYLQMIDTGNTALEGNERLRLNRIVAKLRERVENRVIIAVSALKRTGTGYNPKDLSLDSFRETGGIEYGCNSGYIMVPDLTAEGQSHETRIILRHLKSRGSAKNDIHLNFDGRFHRWTGVNETSEPHALSVMQVQPSEQESHTSGNGIDEGLQEIWVRHQRNKAASNDD